MMSRRVRSPDPHSWLTIAEIAAAHLVTDTTVIGWIHRGLKTPERMLVRLQATKFGNRWRIKKTDLEGFLELMRPGPPVEAESQTTPIKRCYFSLLLRVSIHVKMMPKRRAKRNDVSQSMVLVP
jgi:excisionase family DNA binding protein